MTDSVKLLSPPSNYAAVHLPEREYPGGVFQGDSLHNLHHRISELRELTKKYDDDEVAESLADLDELLSEVVQHYEKVCGERGIGLPYPK